MNRFEKTHEELKRQLASIGIYDSDCPAEISLTVKKEREVSVETPVPVLEKQQEQSVDASLSAS